jgi:hypothetical protein
LTSLTSSNFIFLTSFNFSHSIFNNFFHQNFPKKKYLWEEDPVLIRTQIMKYSKILPGIFIASLYLSVVTAQKAVNFDRVPAHPRILLLKDEEKSIQQSIQTNQIWKKMHETILEECNNMISQPPIERVLLGRRLLDKSRECLKRVFYLSYAYRMTGQEEYLQRAEKEMLAVAKFNDWNPSHFLDVAEMTMALSIGYDWLFDKLSPETKQIISDAILKKGLEPSYDIKYNWFLTANHNWNQVCNAGMTYGALAIYENQPELAKKTIERALNTIHLPMDAYKPDGAYPEGYSYWSYGTTFNVMFLSAIEKAFATDNGLSAIQGFLNTALFREHMTGVTGQSFNWSDCGSRGNLSPAMFWFARKTNNPSLLWMEKDYLHKPNYNAFTEDRLLPAIMIWAKDINLNKISEPTSKFWMGQGSSPVCLMRTSWTDPNAIYLGFKTGSASVNHAHMDIGSFVMDADGVRWASDFGMQDYESLESKGIQVFGRTQDAQRWTIFRMNNFAHNTLTINNQLQLVKGYAKIDKFADKPDFMYAISDLTSVYETQLVSIKRGVAIIDKKYVVIHDELKATAQPTTLRWTMLTSADVNITGKNTATLTKDGKQLYLRIDSPAKIQMKTWSTTPNTTYDAPNPGTTLVGFECEVNPNSDETLQVLLIPGSVGKDISFDMPLGKW